MDKDGMQNNLVSDDDNLRAPNSGFTLPDGQDATYNVALTPIFIWQSGHVDTNLNIIEYVLGSRGKEGRYWSQTAYSDTSAYITYLSVSIFEGNSSGIRQVARSLRCLVSTTNS